MSLDVLVKSRLDRGDVAGAATEAIRALGPAVLGYLRSLVRDDDDAADAFSQFAENVWKGLSSFRGDSTLRAWAFRVAWNVAANIRRDPWRRDGRRLATGEASALAEEIRTKTAIRLARQENALERLRQSLSMEEQSLLALRIDQEMSWAEIAEVMGKAGDPVLPATLMKRFERLKLRLAEMARAQGLLE